MFETPVTVIGSIVGDLKRRQVGTDEMIRFRVASNARRRRDDGSWVNSNSLFINVSCWGRLVTGVGAALGKGAPVIVHGHLHTSEFEDKDGNRRQVTEMKAIAVGPDLSRTIARIEKIGYTGKQEDTEAAEKPDADVEESVPEPAEAGESSEESVNLRLSA
ncbi:single-strand DNA-binding protein [Mycobacteroides chelonae]|nr:single-strand DNA-binding protein [Mycobacteroides chelonae]